MYTVVRGVGLCYDPFPSQWGWMSWALLVLEPVVSPAILVFHQHKHQHAEKGRFHPGIRVKALPIPAGCLPTSTGLEFRGRAWVGTWTQESSLAGLMRDPEDQG